MSDARESLRASRRPMLYAAVQTLCRDSLESSLPEVRKRDDDGEITMAMKAVIYALDALDRIYDEEPALDVGPLGLAYVEKKRDIARRALDGLPCV